MAPFLKNWLLIVFRGHFGPPVRNGVTNTNKPHFLAEYQLYKKTVGHLRGGGVHTPCTLPLDLPLFWLKGYEWGIEVVRVRERQCEQLIMRKYCT